MTVWFASLHDFLSMNGYAIYVWPAWLMVLGLLLVQYVHARHQRRQALNEVRRLERRRLAQQQTAKANGKGTQSNES